MAAAQAAEPLEPAAAAPKLGPGPIRSISITAPKADLPAIMLRHKKRCEALGSNLCQVDRFNSSGEYQYQGGAMSLNVSANVLERLAADMSADSGNLGISINRDGSRGTSKSRSAELRVLRLQADALAKAVTSGNSDERAAIVQKLSEIERNIKQVESQVGETNRIAGQRLEINYRTPEQQNYGGRRWYGELGEMAIKVTLMAIGLALLSVLYFGIIGFGVLWLRRLAIRRGLLKGGPVLPVNPAAPPKH